MSEGPRLKFQEFIFSEVASRLTLIEGHEAVIFNIWAQAEPTEAMKLSLTKVSFGTHLVLKKMKSTQIDLAQKLYYHFNYKGLSYFGELERVVQLDDISYQVECRDRVFAREYRDIERLLTIPHHNVYLYLKMRETSDMDSSNIIPLPHFKSDLKKFEEFERLTSKGLGEDLVGFRVFDISLQGLSFVANKTESDYFKKNQGTKINGTLMFNESSFYLKDIDFIYFINYVNPRARAIPMFKVGLSFAPSQDLTNKIKESLPEAYINHYACHEFENYILGRNDLVKV